MSRVPGNVKRPSTPLNSPTDQLSTEDMPTNQPPTDELLVGAATSYIFSEGSYYTDDQSDGCYSDKPATTAPKRTTNYNPTSDDDPEPESSHAQHCRLHDDPLTLHCNAQTQAHKKCSRKAKIFNTGCYPVCSVHSWYRQLKQAGHCQALEECGHVCNRLAPRAPPYHLCAKHEQGSDTLPCGIMNLPVELHLMILRYVLPETITERGSKCDIGALFRVNHAFHHAASHIVYNELEFHAGISPNSIDFLGRTRPLECPNANYTRVDKDKIRLAAQKIRKLHVDVHLGSNRQRIKGINTHGVDGDDYELYLLRDAVRKFVDLLHPAFSGSATDVPNLRLLKVRPTAWRQHVQYIRDPKMITAAVFFVLEPFCVLGPIEDVTLMPWSKSMLPHGTSQDVIDSMTTLHKKATYRQLRKAWLKPLKASSTPNQLLRDSTTGSGITQEYRKIEELWQLIHEREFAVGAKHGWISTAFQGIERVLHFGRVIDMNIGNNVDEDQERMRQIRQAILNRWVDGLRQQQRTCSAIANCIHEMFQSSSEDPKAAYPDAFDIDTHDPLTKAAPIHYTWPEIEWRDNCPALTEPGVTYTESNFRVHIRQGNKTYVRLKTPSMVRQLRAVKHGL